MDDNLGLDMELHYIHHTWCIYEILLHRPKNNANVVLPYLRQDPIRLEIMF